MATKTELVLDDTLFSADVVASTAQRFTAEFFVDVSRSSAGYAVCLTARDPTTKHDQLAERFKNEVLDERLRERVRGETRDIHSVLIQAALKSAVSSGDH